MKSGSHLSVVPPPIEEPIAAPVAEHEFMTAEEAAKLLRLTPQTVRTYVNEGKIPGARKIGTEIRVHRPTLVASFSTAADPRRKPRRVHG